MKGNKLPITKELVRKNLEEDGAIDGDGHTIMDPQYYIVRGFDPEDIQKLEVTHQSGAGKFQIYSEGDMFTGTPVDELKGVYSLSFHRWVAHEVGIEYREWFGRGTQARIIRDTLQKWANDSEA